MTVDLAGHQEVGRVVREAGNLNQVLEVLEVPAAVVELPQLRELLEEPRSMASESVGREMLVKEEEELDCVVVEVNAVLNNQPINSTGSKCILYSNFTETATQ